MKAGRWWAGLVTGIALMAILPSVAAAASKSGGGSDKAVELPEPLTRDAIRELVARLSDEEVRTLLLAQLDKAAAPDAAKLPPDSMAAGLAEDVDRTRTELGAMFRAVPSVPSELAAAVGRFSEGRSSYHLLVVALGFALMLVVGCVAEWAARRLLTGIGSRLERAREHAHDANGGHVVARVLMEVLLLAVFAVAAAGTFLFFYQGHVASREVIVAALLATLQARVVILVARLLLAPRAPAERALPFDDVSARTLYHGIVSLAWLYVVLDVLSGFMIRWEVPRPSYLVVGSLGRILFVVLFLRLVWRLARPIAAMIRGNGESGLRRMLADLWPILMTGYVLVLFVALTVEGLSGRLRAGRSGILSLLVVMVLPLVDMALCRLLDRREGTRVSGVGSGARASFGPVIRKGVHILVTVAGLLLIVDLWNLDLLGLASQGIGSRVTGVLVNIGLTVLLAYLAWQLAKTAIDRRLEREAAPKAVSEPGEIGGTGASRLKTLLPLARGTIFAVLCVMSVLTILAAFGVNIGPLLAGAGVVGLAVGFGAQTLVRDIISGAFYLMDDAFRIGEYIDVGEAKGTVERIGIRSMHLRHHRGPINVVPYGAIRRMTNQSRDWVVEKLDFRLTYDTDMAKVKKIIKRIGQELQADPTLGPNILQPLKSQGVLAMEDSALLVKAKFTAKPGEQFVIRREAYQRVKQAFDEAGIHFAHRQVTVFVPPGEGGAAATAAAAGGAVAAALAAEAAAEKPA